MPKLRPDEYSLTDLRQAASEIDLPGRSKMNKEELALAILGKMPDCPCVDLIVDGVPSKLYLLKNGTRLLVVNTVTVQDSVLASATRKVFACALAACFFFGLTNQSEMLKIAVSFTAGAGIAALLNHRMSQR